MIKILTSFLLIAVILASITNQSFSNTTSLTNKSLDISKKNDDDKFNVNMTKAWLKFNEGDYHGALRIYRELYTNNADNATLNLRIGQCYVAIKEMNQAVDYLNKAYNADNNIDKDIHFLLGQALQFKGDLDKAIESYERYKNKLIPTEGSNIVNQTKGIIHNSEKDIVNKLIKQCKNAIELMNNPVNVKISNLGNNINSKYTDACPSISADGETLIFTSRRKGSTGEIFDYDMQEYYDDVYISSWNKETKSWNNSSKIPGDINTDAHDANMSISPDGQSIYVYKNIEGVTKSGDIYVSKYDEEKGWTKPKAFGNKYINSTYFESSACITADGKTMFFVSERDKEGYGNGDIYFVKKEGSTWGKPKNLGPVINTIHDEIGVSIHPDGKTLFFSSNGHNTMGGHDIFMSVLENNKWTTPINLGYPINTTKEEIHFVFTTDRQTAYISSSRDGGLGKTDIYKINMSSYFKNNDNIDDKITKAITGTQLAILKGSIVSAENSEPIETSITIKDLTNDKTKVITTNKKGEYFITLPADRKYDLSIDQKGYKVVNVKIKLPTGDINDTPTLIKHIILDKK